MPKIHTGRRTRAHAPHRTRMAADQAVVGQFVSLAGAENAALQGKIVQVEPAELKTGDGSQTVTGSAEDPGVLVELWETVDGVAAPTGAETVALASALTAIDPLDAPADAAESVPGGETAPNATAPALAVGDFVSWSDPDGTAGKGQVVQIETAGSMALDDASASLTGTATDPAVLIDRWAEGETGAEPTGMQTLAQASALTKIDPLPPADDPAATEETGPATVPPPADAADSGTRKASVGPRARRAAVVPRGRLAPDPAALATAGGADQPLQLSCVVSTGARVKVPDYFGPAGGVLFEEELIIAGARLETLRGAPVLIDHCNTVDCTVGRVTAVRVEQVNGAPAIVADFVLPPLPDTAPLRERIKAGVITDVSVGYDIHAVEESEQDGQRLVRVTDWSPCEVSLVGIGADPAAGIRARAGQRGGRSPSLATVTRTRASAGSPADVHRILASEARALGAVDLLPELIEQSVGLAEGRRRLRDASNLRHLCRVAGQPASVAAEFVRSRTPVTAARALLQRMRAADLGGHIETTPNHQRQAPNPAATVSAWDRYRSANTAKS